MKKGLNVKSLSREEWLEARRAGIGGSDAAAICGLNPWKSAAAVYIEKMGEAPVQAESERLRVGRDLEDYVAKRFSEATGKRVRRNNFMLHHDEYPFILGDIDRAIIGEDAILECKTTNSFAAKDWVDEPPLHYQIQCQHYLLVTGAARCYIAALIGNERFAWFAIERDEETMADLLTVEVDFWQTYVEQHECPPPDGSAAYNDFLVRRFPHDNGASLALSSQASDALGEYLALKAQRKALDKTIDLYEQTVKAEMGDAREATSATGDRVSWKTQSRTTVDSKRLKAEQPEIYEEYTKTSESRVFRVSQVG